MNESFTCRSELPLRLRHSRLFGAFHSPTVRNITTYRHPSTLDENLSSVDDAIYIDVKVEQNRLRTTWTPLSHNPAVSSDNLGCLKRRLRAITVTLSEYSEGRGYG